MGVPITFVECQTSGYKARTKQNILETDGTLAIYVDGTTAGEKTTLSLALGNDKPFFSFDLLDGLPVRKKLDLLIDWFKTYDISNLNVAGNGLYTFKKKFPKYHQAEVDDIVGLVLYKTSMRVEKIQSGGQTGVDEAGIRYAIIHGIEAKVVAPKNWAFRDENGIDHYDKKLFQQRFVKDIIAAAEGADIPERD